MIYIILDAAFFVPVKLIQHFGQETGFERCISINIIN